MDATTIPMTRTDLRRAISDHPQWADYRAKHGLKIDAMTMAELRSAGEAIGIAGATTATAGSVEPVDLFGKPASGASAVKDKAKAAIGLMAAIEAIAGQSMDREAVAELVREEVKAAMADAPVVRIEVKRHDGTTATVNGHKHPMLETLLKVCAARDAMGNHINIWIAGPAGSGKTHSAPDWLTPELVSAKVRFIGEASHLERLIELGIQARPKTAISWQNPDGSIERTVTWAWNK